MLSRFVEAIRKKVAAGGGDEADLEQITEDYLVETVQSLCETLDEENTAERKCESST